MIPPPWHERFVYVSYDEGVKKWNESGFRPPLCTYRLNWARRTSWGWWDEWGGVGVDHGVSTLIQEEDGADYLSIIWGDYSTGGKLSWGTILLGEKLCDVRGRGPRVVASTAAFHARVRDSFPGLGGLNETKMFLPHPRLKLSIVGSLRDREVAYSVSDLQGFEIRIMCLEGSVISLISPSSGGSPGPI